MTGEDLYNEWAEAMTEQGLNVNDFQFLSDAEQAAWDALAKDFTARGLK